ncbi:MAG: hypothetical protein A2020_05775 [Lentisphaerae bacterium GWF2_45_14]|nr:MAG: hypothetical protein A2020_05775 [Lentisphaerae bacterium GWF2_45_14]
MKRVIFYFSATGNTLTAAREFAEELGDTQIVSIPALGGEPYNIKGLDVGIAFPVYSGIMPNIVTRFVESMSPSPGQYFFGICTCGGLPLGALDHLDRVLRKKGAKLSIGTGLVMPSNYLPFGEAPCERKQKAMFEKASREISRAVKIVGAGNKGCIRSTFFPLNMFSRVSERFFASRFHLDAKKFRVSSSCTGCGLCARVCPVGNIEMTDGRPVWGDKCELCYGCINWCPCNAIDCGRFTSGKKRYHHPGISPEDIAPSSSIS